MRKPIAPHEMLLDSLLLLAFFSLLTGFIEATYTFGLLGTNIPPQIVFVLLLLAPLLALPFPRLLESKIFAIVTGSLGLLCWAASLPLGTQWRMLATGLGCGLFLLLLAARVLQAERSPLELGTGLGLAVLLSILLRTLHSGNLSLSGGLSLLLGVILCALAIGLLVSFDTRKAPVPETTAGRIGFGRTLGLSLGFFGSLVMLYFGFTSPAVIARWFGASDTAVIAVEAGSLALCIGLWHGLPGVRSRLSAGVLAAWNLLFLLALGTGLLLRQPDFSAAAVYPLDEPTPGLLASICPWVMLVLHPVIYVDFGLLAGELHERRPSSRHMAGSFAICGLFILLASLAQIFTTVYDYIPVIGPWFRDRFWIVVSLPGIVMALSLLLVRPRPVDSPAERGFRPLVLVGCVILAAAAVCVAGATAAHPSPAAAGASVRILAYNIQQGYGKNGEKSTGRQIEAIRSANPDILGLEETDSARIAGGNSDLVRLFADRLNMYSYAAPSPVSGTFGVALLSKYPIGNPHAFFMKSHGEQTAAIEAEIDVGGKSFRVLVTHLGNDGEMVQQKAVLDRALAGLPAAATLVVMGDFNFRPDTDQYRVTTSLLDDAWITAAQRTIQPGASDPSDKIDNIFVSRGTRVLDSVYLPEGPSDHPAMFAEIAR